MKHRLHPTSISWAPRIDSWSLFVDRRLVWWEMSCPLFSFGFSCLFCWMFFCLSVLECSMIFDVQLEKKSGRDLETKSCILLQNPVYSAVFLDFSSPVISCHTKNHVEGKKLKPLSNVTSQGVVPWRATPWDIYSNILSKLHTQKRRSNQSRQVDPVSKANPRYI